MARFYGEVYGQAGTPATRIGSPASGIRSHTRGWDVGVSVGGEEGPRGDVFFADVTGGSNGRIRPVRVCDIEHDAGEITVRLHNPLGEDIVYRVGRDGTPIPHTP